MATIQFAKYHGLGNDYLVVTPQGLSGKLTPERVRAICDRHYGVGSDGVLFGPLKTEEADFRLEIYNPDGSPAEKSGNGLRIFSRWLWDQGLVRQEPFTIRTAGGLVTAQVHAGGGAVTVAMGRASFDSAAIPVLGERREVVDERMEIAGVLLTYCAVSMGNPHCVVLRPKARSDEAFAWGPHIEHEPRFPNRTNVQFLEVLDRENLRIEIWERGAGYTLASGSSSCAAAAAACRMGLCERAVQVHNPGGVLRVCMAEDYSITLSGPVARVSEGIYYEDECK
jgi:diaminopimelate epimerase